MSYIYMDMSYMSGYGYVWRFQGKEGQLRENYLQVNYEINFINRLIQKCRQYATVFVLDDS